MASLRVTIGSKKAKVLDELFKNKCVNNDCERVIREKDLCLVEQVRANNITRCRADGRLVRFHIALISCFIK